MSEQIENTEVSLFFRVWHWLRWVVLAGIILFLLIWGLPRLSALVQKPLDEAQSEPNQEILSLLDAIAANQEKIGDRLDSLEAEPIVEEPGVEEPVVVEPVAEEELVADEPVVEEPEVVEAKLRTAADIRAFGRVLGWVTGGDAGQFVQGAQIALKEDFVLLTLPSGDIFEFECVQYLVINDEVMAHPVCEGALVRFGTDSVVPEGSIGTLWLTRPVVGSDTEEWAEGFLNEPCVCPNGDCRDE